MAGVKKAAPAQRVPDPGPGEGIGVLSRPMEWSLRSSPTGMTLIAREMPNGVWFDVAVLVDPVYARLLVDRLKDTNDNRDS